MSSTRNQKPCITPPVQKSGLRTVNVGLALPTFHYYHAEVALCCSCLLLSVGRWDIKVLDEQLSQRAEATAGPLSTATQ